MRTEKALARSHVGRTSRGARFGFALGLVAATVLGCADDEVAKDGETTIVRDAGPDVIRNGEVENPDPTIECNALTVDGLAAGTLEYVTEAAPAAVGGAIADGTYVFEKAVVFGAPSDAEPSEYMRAKLVILAGKVQRATQETDTLRGFTQQFVTSGTSLTIKTTCPAETSDEVATYSVVAAGAGAKARLVLYEDLAGTTVSAVFERE